MSENDLRPDPSTSSTVLIGFVGAIVTFTLIVALQALYYHYEEAEKQAKTSDITPPTLTRSKAEQQDHLTSYGWIDREKDIVHIPIELAIDSVVRELGAPATRPATGTSSGS